MAIGKKIFLIEHMIAGQHQVSIFLINGIKLIGKIAFKNDEFLILVKDKMPQIIYLHAISSVLPAGEFDHSSVFQKPDDDLFNLHKNIMGKFIGQQLSVKLFMMNGICLSGVIVGEFETSFILRIFDGEQEVLKSAITTMAPSY